jgi:hypothetical protein
VSGSVKSLPGKLCLDPRKHRGGPEKPQVLPGQKPAGVWLQLLVRAWLRDRSSFSLHLIAGEWLEVAARATDVVLGAVRLVPPVGRMDDRPLISSSRADQVVADDKRTNEKGEDDVPPPPTAFRASVNQ